jgi:hypothetical protein
MPDVDVLAVLVATIAAFVVGATYYASSVVSLPG